MSLGGAPLPWSAEQQEWLAALGYTVYVEGSLDEVPVAKSAAMNEVDDTAAETPVAAGPARTAHAEIAPARAPSAAPAPRSRAPEMDEGDATPAPARTQAARPRGAGRLPDRLHFALIRASGCNPNAEGAAEIFATWPASAELRGNAAAKRALWPRLRALRRNATP